VPLDIREITVDHYIPEHLEDKAAELAKVRKGYGLPDNFAVNDFGNWLPAHWNCNQEKWMGLPWPIDRAATVLKGLLQDAPKLKEKEKRFRDSIKNKGTLLASLGTALDKNILTREEVLAFLQEPVPQDRDVKPRQIYRDEKYAELLSREIDLSFFLEEFQDIAYFIERIHKTAFGDALGTSKEGGTHQIVIPILRFHEFLPDTLKIGHGVNPQCAGSEGTLKSNRLAFVEEFVLRTRFMLTYPTTLTSAQFIDQLNANAGMLLTKIDRDRLVSDLVSRSKTRADALLSIAESDLLRRHEFNRAFVLILYFLYLRRNPNEPPDNDFTGYETWLRRLNQSDGDSEAAEVVSEFLTSDEYKQRFGLS